jgi:hypothetical protein
MSSSSSSSSINISGIDKVQLLKALWLHSKPARFFDAFPSAPVPYFDEKEANVAVKRYIDYFQGRLIKCDLSKDEVEPRLYDRDFGQGAFSKVVASVRK